MMLLFNGSNNRTTADVSLFLRRKKSEVRSTLPVTRVKGVLARRAPGLYDGHNKIIVKFADLEGGLYDVCCIIGMKIR
jgi:hypothetical protein